MEYVDCNLCGSRNWYPLFCTEDYVTGDMQKVVKCNNCGLVFVNPQPNADELHKFYPESYYGNEPFLYEKIDSSQRLKNIKRAFGPGSGRILDIGCGKGLLLKALEKEGWEVFGIELSETSARYARAKLNIHVNTESVEECKFPENYFDVVTMFHSLEHMRDPKKTLAAIYPILKNNGILIIEIPKFDSIYSSIFKDKWFHLDVPRHLFHFESKTISQMLKAARFRIKLMRNFSILYDAFGGVQSILNCICHRMNLLNDFNTKRLNFSTLKKSVKRRSLQFDLIISNILFPLFLFFFLFFSLMLSIGNWGGTLTIQAEKESI